MFTRHSDKPLLALSALASIGLILAVIASGLSAVATWAERDLHAFPFKNEDWLRYLLPARFEDLDRSRIMLAGASTARENLRYDLFEEAFPDYDIFQGSFVYATFEDVTVSLEYIERVYGVDALPEILVLGIAPRVAANEPNDRPFKMGLNRYSPYFSTLQEPTRITLKSKGPLEGLSARGRFLIAKYPERFRTGLLAALNHFITNGETESGEDSRGAKAANWLIKLPGVALILEKLGYPEFRDYEVQEVLAWLISPYKYSLDPPLKVRMVTREDYVADASEIWWPSVYFWDPRENEVETRARVRHFAEFIDRHGISLFVVNLPEHDASRLMFDESNYEAYLEFVQSELTGADFLDLRDFLDPIDFYDREHTTTGGSIRLTKEIIRNMQDTSLVLPAGEEAGQ